MLGSRELQIVIRSPAPRTSTVSSREHGLPLVGPARVGARDGVPSRGTRTWRGGVGRMHGTVGRRAQGRRGRRTGPRVDVVPPAINPYPLRPRSGELVRFGRQHEPREPGCAVTVAVSAGHGGGLCELHREPCRFRQPPDCHSCYDPGSRQSGRHHTDPFAFDRSASDPQDVENEESEAIFRCIMNPSRGGRSRRRPPVSRAPIVRSS